MGPYEIIKENIILGALHPGERLKEELLAKKLNVSRTPIRSALQKLESDGLVMSIAHKGFIVRDFSLSDVKQIYNLRALLEGFAASEAALNRNENDILLMKKYNTDFKNAIDSNEASNITRVKDIQKTNHLFHNSVFNGANNDFLKYHISKVTVVPLIFRSYYWFSKQQLTQSLDAHEVVINAIQNSEPERARIAIQEHIYLGRDYVIKNGEKIKKKLLEGEDYDKHLRSRST